MVGSKPRRQDEAPDLVGGQPVGLDEGAPVPWEPEDDVGVVLKAVDDLAGGGVDGLRLGVDELTDDAFGDASLNLGMEKAADIPFEAI